VTTTTRLKQAKAELLRRRAVLLETARSAAATLEGLAGTDRGQEFEEVAQAETGLADLARLGEAERREIQRIDAALDRMQAGQWGLCAACGEEIERKRMEALPWAIRCANCATLAERGMANP
jgi:DnaK suppressor protein